MEQFGAVLDLDWIACVESIWAARFLCLKGVRQVLKSGEIKVEAWKARNDTRKRNPSWRGMLSYPTLSYLILPYHTLSYLQLQGGILITFQHFLSDSRSPKIIQIT